MNKSEHYQLFDEWLKQHTALLFKVVRSYTKTEEERDDLFQNICLQVWRSIPSFQYKSSVTTWIYRISLNTAINWSTKERRHDANHQSLDDGHPILTAIDYEEDERLQWLYLEIGRLNEIDRSLTLLLLDGYSYKEMAEISGISENNIGVKIHRIKKQLMKKSKVVTDHGI